MRQPGDGTPMLSSRGKFVRGRADDGADGFYAVLPPGVSRLGRVREHEPAHCLGDITGVYAAADIARGERSQLEMVALTGNDATHQFRVVARFGTDISPGSLGSAAVASRRPDRNKIEVVELIDRLTVYDFDAMREGAVDATVVVRLR